MHKINRMTTHLQPEVNQLHRINNNKKELRFEWREWNYLPNNIEIHLLFQLGSFVPRSAVIQHSLCFMAGINNNAFDKIRVLWEEINNKLISTIFLI